MKPDNIFLVRHGQSFGNVNKEVYKDIPDYAIKLTDVGHIEANQVGKNIKNIVKDSSVQFYVSPFWRTRQTYEGIRKSFLDNSLCKYYEDPRIREQEWSGGLIDRLDDNKREEYRDNYGHFYYRFKDGGESCADTMDRVSDFMGTLHRDFKKKDFPRNVIIVTHGMTMRLFIMRWFHCSVEEFEQWANPRNCEYLLLSRKENEKYKLETPLRRHKLRHKFQYPLEDKQEIFKFPHIMPYEIQ